jgi:hypothetical protein
MAYAFTDTNGKRYYEFTQQQAVPMARFEKLKTYIGYMQLRMTPENVDMLVDKAIQYITEGIGKDKNAARVAALIMELKGRKDLVVPAELIYNYIALLYVREDEYPGSFKTDIHMEKVDQLMKESRSADPKCFFFHLKEWKRLFDSLTMSPTEWENYIEESTAQGDSLIERARIYSSEK